MFCSRDFFLLHDNAPAHKAASVCQSLIQKKKKECYKLLSSPVLSRFISARLFSVPQVENEVKRNPICGCFCANVCIYASGAYFELKKICVFLTCLRFLKLSVLKLLDRTVYVCTLYCNITARRPFTKLPLKT